MRRGLIFHYIGNCQYWLQPLAANDHATRKYLLDFARSLDHRGGKVSTTIIAEDAERTKPEALLAVIVSFNV